MSAASSRSRTVPRRGAPERPGVPIAGARCWPTGFREAGIRRPLLPARWLCQFGIGQGYRAGPSDLRRWPWVVCRGGPWWPRSPGVAGDRQPAVEIESGADERQMRERLREVAEMLRLKAELLAVEPLMIGVPEHLLEEKACLLQVSHAGEALDVPE